MYRTICRRDAKTQHLDAIVKQLKPNRTFPLHLAKPMFSLKTIGDMQPNVITLSPLARFLRSVDRAS